MPAKQYPFPEWQPDLANNVLTRAVNVRAIENGYAPVRAPQAVTVALSGYFNGGGSFVDSTGATSLIVANQAGVAKYTGSAWGSIGLSFANPSRNAFAQYGDKLVIATNLADSLINYDLIAGTWVHCTDAPKAIDVAQVRDFVMAITTDNAVQWSQFNNSVVWTTGANQADKQPSLWGKLRRVVGGEYGILISDRAVVRATYVGIEGGLDIIWQFDEISAETGCMAAGSVCNVGRLIFFLSERGFEMCDGREVEPIGDEKFNRWFFSTYSRADIANIWSAIDPRNSTALWGMPGTPGTIIAYNWVLKKATTFQINVSGMFSGYTSGTSLDALDAIYGNLDAMTISMDDPSLQGGNPILLIAGADNALYALTGDNLEAILRLDNIEPSPGKRSRIRNIRLVSDTTSASATIDARMRPGDAEAIRSAAVMRANGKMPIRSNGRYNTLEVTIPAVTDWSFIQGCELEYDDGDGR